MSRCPLLRSRLVAALAKRTLLASSSAFRPPPTVRSGARLGARPHARRPRPLGRLERVPPLVDRPFWCPPQHQRTSIPSAPRPRHPPLHTHIRLSREDAAGPAARNANLSVLASSRAPFASPVIFDRVRRCFSEVVSPVPANATPDASGPAEAPPFAPHPQSERGGGVGAVWVVRVRTKRQGGDQSRSFMERRARKGYRDGFFVGAGAPRGAGAGDLLGAP